jgi:hypothetical protein
MKQRFASSRAAFFVSFVASALACSSNDNAPAASTTVTGSTSSGGGSPASTGAGGSGSATGGSAGALNGTGGAGGTGGASSGAGGKSTGSGGKSSGAGGASTSTGGGATQDGGPGGGRDAGSVDDGGTRAMGPLKVSTTNSHYFVDPSGKAVLLSGSHTWNTLQDLTQGTTPPPFDFSGYASFLKSRGHNVTILWRKDLPTFCNWGAGGTWHVSPFPWARTGPGNATDGLPKFDLSKFDTTYFDRLRARALELRSNGIYAIVQLFDGLQLLNNRCGNDGYPFTGANNINGVDDGGGTNSMNLSVPAITTVQDALVQKVIDTVNDLDNVLWEISEEAPSNSTSWEDHMISLIHTYEATKPLQHPVGYPWLTGGNDATLYASAAEWVAPIAKVSPTSNSGKVIINDSDHSYFGIWNDSAQVNRNYVWENFANGSQVIFMDPYTISWPTQNRNLCVNPSNGVCTGPDARWQDLRLNLGYTVSFGNKMDLLHMTPQPALSSTNYCLAHVAATGAEFLVYAPSGGMFTVNLAGITGMLNVEWFNPATGATTTAAAVPGGQMASFTAPFGNDAVLHLK